MYVKILLFIQFLIATTTQDLIPITQSINWRPLSYTDFNCESLTNDSGISLLNPKIIEMGIPIISLDTKIWGKLCTKSEFITICKTNFLGNHLIKNHVVSLPISIHECEDLLFGKYAQLS
jgi:hypothetical protein